MTPTHDHTPRPGDLEFNPLTNAERRAHADALTARANDPHRRALRLTEAAKNYALLGDNLKAEHLFKQALPDNSATPGAVHGSYAAFLFDQGRETEALTLINQARRLQPDDPEVFSLIGETLLEHQHPTHATRWFTGGLARALGDLPGIELNDLAFSDTVRLARGRHHARRTLNQPTDHIDEIYERHRAEHTPG